MFAANAGGGVIDELEFVWSSRAQMQQPPAGSSYDGRVVGEIAGVNGIIAGVSYSGEVGLAIWDWNSVTNKYEIKNFRALSFDYGARFGANAALSTENTYVTFGDSLFTPYDPNLNDPLDYSVVTIASYPDTAITLTTPKTFILRAPFNKPNANESVEFMGQGQGFNGKAVFGYYQRKYEPSGTGYSSSIGAISYVTANGTHGSVAPINSGYPDVSFQGQPGLYSAIVGGPNTTGYLVMSAQPYNYSQTNTAKYILVNATSSLSITNSVTFSAYQINGAVLPVTSTRFIAFNRPSSQDDNGRIDILYVDSATSPTTVSKGGSISHPTWPGPELTGLPIQASDVEGGYWFAFSEASQFWMGGTGNCIAWYIYDVYPTSAYGISVGAQNSVIVFVPYKIITTSNTSGSLELITTDMDGLPVPPIPYYDGPNAEAYGNYSAMTFGAPGNKGVFFWKDTTGTNPNLPSKWNQRIIQL